MEPGEDWGWCYTDEVVANGRCVTGSTSVEELRGLHHPQQGHCSTICRRNFSPG